MIHFVPSVLDVSNNLFIFTIWGDDNGQPGDVLYEDDLFNLRTPQYHFSQNRFSYYALPDTMRLAVNGTFYVGWRQIDAERLNVGLDRNIINNDRTFYSTDNELTWNSSSIEGSVMIRPVFSTAMNATLGIETIEEVIVESSVKIYPNPTKSLINIEINKDFQGVEVLNMQGQLILRSESPTVDLSILPRGMYFLKIDGINELQKIIRD